MLRASLSGSEDEIEFFSKIAELSPKAKDIALFQVLNYVAMPSYLSDASVGSTLQDDHRASMNTSSRILEYQHGVRLGWLYSLHRLVEEDWTNVLFLETVSVDHDTRKIVVSYGNIGQYLGSRREVDHDAIAFMGGVYPNTALLFRGFTDGRRAFERYCRSASIEIIVFLQDYVGKNISEISQGKSLTPQEKREILVKVPHLESMLFLRTILAKKEEFDSKTVEGIVVGFPQ